VRLSINAIFEFAPTFEMDAARSATAFSARAKTFGDTDFEERFDFTETLHADRLRDQTLVRFPRLIRKLYADISHCETSVIGNSGLSSYRLEGAIYRGQKRVR
jgi:hypothetical protein